MKEKGHFQLYSTILMAWLHSSNTWKKISVYSSLLYLQNLHSLSIHHISLKSWKNKKMVFSMDKMFFNSWIKQEVQYQEWVAKEIKCQWCLLICSLQTWYLQTWWLPIWWLLIWWLLIWWIPTCSCFNLKEWLPKIILNPLLPRTIKLNLLL